MITYLRISGLALITIATLVLATADKPLLVAIGVASLIGIGIAGFALCVMAGEVTEYDLNEANNSIRHPDEIEGKN